ncbi:unnamed protein product [Camellia sinensis]
MEKENCVGIEATNCHLKCNENTSNCISSLLAAPVLGGVLVGSPSTVGEEKEESTKCLEFRTENSSFYLEPLLLSSDLPIIARTAGKLAGRAIGYVQLARGQFDTIMHQTQARQVHKELQDTIAQLEAIRHEIRTVSFMNPGPLTRRLVDNLDQTSAASGNNEPEKPDTANRSTNSGFSDSSTNSGFSDMHSQATAYAKLAESTAINSESVESNEVINELTDESGIMVLPVSAKSTGLLPDRKDNAEGSDIMLEAILEAEVARNAKDFFAQHQNQIKWNHKSVMVIRRNQVVGGITYRPYVRRGNYPSMGGGANIYRRVSQMFGEIAFCAITADEQVKGYGTRLMNHLKQHARDVDRLTHFLTYADNNAVGYFIKQDWSSTQIPSRNSALIAMIADEAFPGQTMPNTVAAVPHPPSIRPRVRARRGQATDPHSIAERAMHDHPDAWPFKEPVDAHDVPDYYEIIKDPIDLKKLSKRVESEQYYVTFEMFVADVKRMFCNARTYNSPETIYYKCTNRHVIILIKKNMKDCKSNFRPVVAQAGNLFLWQSSIGCSIWPQNPALINFNL